MKKTILVPADFSKASSGCLEYATEMCIRMNASLTALHVLADAILPKEAAAKKRFVEDNQEHFEAFVKRHTKNSKKLPVKCLVETGAIVNNIVDTSIEEDALYIVIGTKAKHSFLDYLLGSVSENLEKKTIKPMLVIPEGTTYKKPEHIAFPNNVNYTSKPIRSYLKAVAGQLDAALHQVYIIPPSKFTVAQKEETRTTDWMKKEGEAFAQLTLVRDKSFMDGLDFYVKEHAPDMIAMYVSHREGFRNLLHKSLAQEVTHHTRLPLLVFREDSVIPM